MTPEGWRRAPVGSLGEVVAGKAKNTTGNGENRPYLRVANVFDGRIDITDVLEMPFSDEEFARYRLKPGDVLLNEGQSLELVGRCAMYRGEYPGPCGIQNALVRFRAGPHANPAFAEQLFRWCQRSGVFAEIATQTTSIAHLGVKRFAELELLFPPLPEQRKIAAILSSVDDAIESTQAVIDQLGVVKKAMMAELLTRGLPGRHTRFKTTEIGEVPEEWEVVPLGQVADVAYGLTVNSQRRASPVTRPYLTVANVQQEGFDLSTVKEIGVLPGDTERYVLRAGDLLIVEGNANPDRLGRAFVWQDEVAGALHQNHLIRARPSATRASPRWLAMSVNGASGRRHIVDHAKTSSGLHTINSKVVAGLPVALPALREQEEIVSVYSSLEGRIESERRWRDGLRDIKAALMSVLLTGEVRVNADEEAA